MIYARFPLRVFPFALLLLCGFAFSGCTTVLQSTPPSKSASPPRTTPKSGRIPGTQRPYQIEGKTYYPLPSAEGYSETGIASWYGNPFHGRKTSNGETYNMYDWTAAHKTLPMNTRLLVENLDNGRTTTVRVNDRGPFVGTRIIDLSYNVARDLGIMKEGTGKVRITALGEAETVQLADNKTATRFLPHEDFQKGDFFVQIGAFTVQKNADRLKDTMNRGGREAETVRYDRGDQIFYRVQVKAGTTLAQAKQMEQTMAGSGFSKAFVVAR
ncbi:septal ring lytic transglycosylase RlpA family protein [Thiovibrio frasassiensis]|uniref:Probable endolytic peptidoglycan transglycosylase RlpA n=1 Tax=Thiovibrio frasassiensis TaxID=2984131 RepID=A0A9X4MG32_9BACT|nr:septal ring lytic transglycosylase RlpA family protein [Thiovibrio frasassiensis]MDG4475992.1 septal ring lytic transglycosylase RlpA family protein [Thiovibrio frasassiensis]